MGEPFSAVLPSGERLLAAGEAELGVITGPLAAPAEMLAYFSPVIAIILALQLDGATAKILGAVLPPLLLIALARYPLRRWGRPREWVGVTDERLVIWRRPAGLKAEPRIESIPVPDVERAELTEDVWDRRHHTHQLLLYPHVGGPRNVARVHAAESLRDALHAAIAAATPIEANERRPAPDFLPPGPPPVDYRP